MKKLVLFTALLIGLTTVTATAETKTANQDERLQITKRYRYSQPVLFVERGVEFMIFPDGSFDFNTNYGNQVYRPNSRRSSINNTFGAPGKRVHYSTSRSRGVLITHDYDGKVRRIGNIFINYDKRGRIKRAGSVYMKYDKKRHRQLKQVGGLHIKYNRWGKIIYSSGQVNRFNTIGECGVGNDYGDYYNDNDDDWFDDDDDYYYRNSKKTKKRKRKNDD
jgi:hypothetical protein